MENSKKSYNYIVLALTLIASAITITVFITGKPSLEEMLVTIETSESPIENSLNNEKNENHEPAGNGESLDGQDESQESEESDKSSEIRRAVNILPNRSDFASLEAYYEAIYEKAIDHSVNGKVKFDRIILEHLVKKKPEILEHIVKKYHKYLGIHVLGVTINRYLNNQDEKALEETKRLKADRENYSELNITLADIYFENRDYDNAIIYSNRALIIAQDENTAEVACKLWEEAYGQMKSKYYIKIPEKCSNI